MITSLLHESVEAKKFDVRTVERNLQKGILKAEEVQAASSELPDDADNAEIVSIDTLLGSEGDSQSKGTSD